MPRLYLRRDKRAARGPAEVDSPIYSVSRQAMLIWRETLRPDEEAGDY
jgi:hypothetical protein